MYAFQFFAKAANELELYAKLYAKGIFDLENRISLKYNNISLIIFDNNGSTTGRLIFYIDFIYQDTLYDIKANVIPDFLLSIFIDIEIQKDGNFINDESIRREVNYELYEALMIII